MTNKPREPASGTPVRDGLRQVLAEPSLLERLPPQELDFALRVARRGNVLGYLAARLQRDGLLNRLPLEAADQLESTLVHAEASTRLALWELNRILSALADGPPLDVVVLKGCAYALAGLPNHRGRSFADVDLLFAEADLKEAERRLLRRGWRSTKLTPYDQHYYRVWTHELPPISHPQRGVEADLHHNILPRTSRLRPQAAKLLADAQPLPANALYGIPAGRLKRLSDADLVLHTMTHLFYDSDFADRLRDLADVDLLLRHFAADDEAFYERVARRAVELDLARPAFYALYFSVRWLATPVPAAALDAARASGAPPKPVLVLMAWLIERAIFPRHPDKPSRVAALARTALYMRSHWIKMPPFLLSRHLTYKLFVRLRDAWQRRRAPRAPERAPANPALASEQTRATPPPPP